MHMIHVYYTKVSSFLKEGTFWSQLNKVEEERRIKIQNMRDQKTKMCSLSAGSLLHFALCRELGLLMDSAGPFSIGYQEGGKPFLKEHPGVFFNLSHSGEYVCCAIGREPVGVDIQRHIRVKEGLAERFFTKEDKKRLAECKEQERKLLFFRMWSIKESYIKLNGKGLSQGLDSFEIDWENRAVLKKDKKEPAAFFEEKDLLPGYSLCLCSESAGQKVIWMELSGIFGD